LECDSLRLCLLLTLLLLAGPPCFGAEGGSGAYWPGFRNYAAGIVPPKPGLYLRDDTLVYSAGAPRVVLNGQPVENISIDAVVNIVQPSYVFPRKLFGATHALVVTQPFVWAKLSGRIIGTSIEPSGKRLAPGDAIISPLYLGWNKGKLHYNSNLAIFIPTGDFDIHRVVNTGRNFWTFDPEFGITYLDPKTGWDVSGAIGYSINTENPATNYMSGDMLHLDYAAGKTLKNGLKPGVVGYAIVQTTPDSGSGAIFGSFESQVFSIGPAIQWKSGKRSDLMLRYYHEFGAKNHLEGNQLAFSLKMTF
jgi:hypothetical protein